MAFEPRCLATGIGSMPHTDLAAAMDVVARTIPDIPYTPQLPALSWHEGMIVQYTEGLPGRTLDEQREKIHLDTEPGLAGREGCCGKASADGDAV